MGYIRHDAILVTTWNREATDAAANKAREMGLAILGPSDEAMNGYRTLLVCPDGSKEGWDLSDEFDARRKAFVEYLNGVRYEDGETCLEWVAVAYGGDDYRAEITASAWGTKAKP